MATLQEVARVRLVCQLEDVLDQVADPIRKVVGDTLDTVQRHYYLVPKSVVNETGELVPRDPPVDAVEEQISKLWSGVNS